MMCFTCMSFVSSKSHCAYVLACFIDFGDVVLIVTCNSMTNVCQ